MKARRLTTAVLAALVTLAAVAVWAVSHPVGYGALGLLSLAGLLAFRRRRAA